MACVSDTNASGGSTDRGEPITAFIDRARPLSRAGAVCKVAGCDREDRRRARVVLVPQSATGSPTHEITSAVLAAELAAWVAAEAPRLGMHQFSLAGLPELLRVELLYALQQRDQAPPPLDPTRVRMLLARLGDARSLREADSGS